MAENADDVRKGEKSHDRLADSTDGELPEVTCTLTDDETERRREWIRENLLPHLETVDDRRDGFAFVFDRNTESYGAVTELAWNEAQCCSWATFAVELPPEGDTVEWHARSEREEGVEFFGDSVEELRDTFEDLPAPE